MSCITGQFFAYLQMHIPTEHFENIPVYTLSPSPVTQENATDLHIYEKYAFLHCFSHIVAQPSSL